MQILERVYAELDGEEFGLDPEKAFKTMLTKFLEVTASTFREKYKDRVDRELMREILNDLFLVIHEYDIAFRTHVAWYLLKVMVDPPGLEKFHEIPWRVLFDTIIKANRNPSEYEKTVIEIMHDAGMSMHSISRCTGRSSSTIHKILKEKKNEREIYQ